MAVDMGVVDAQVSWLRRRYPTWCPDDMFDQLIRDPRRGRRSRRRRGSHDVELC